jgi:hypothetical protein
MACIARKLKREKILNLGPEERKYSQGRKWEARAEEGSFDHSYYKQYSFRRQATY